MKVHVNFFIVIDIKMNTPVRKRGRPRILDRDTGLAIAAKLFWKHGYEGTSISDLTSAMEITAPSLYALFGSKEELYQQALDFNINLEAKPRSEILFQSELCTFDALKLYLYEAAKSMTDPNKPRGCIISTAVLQHAQQNESIAKAVASRRDASIQMMKSRFDRAIAENELAQSTDTEALSRFYSAVVQGMSAQSCDGACEQTLKNMIDIALCAWPGSKKTVS